MRKEIITDRNGRRLIKPSGRPPQPARGLEIDFGATPAEWEERAKAIRLHAAKHPGARIYNELSVATLLIMLATLARRVEALETAEEVSEIAR